MRLGKFSVVSCLLFSVACGSSDESALSSYLRPAQFKISDKTATNVIEPFTATVSSFGNSLIREGGGFEPSIFRSKFTALEDSANRVVIAPEALLSNDSLREGFFDGADVRVYRIDHGKFRLVREDTVLPGGSHMSGWIPVLPAGKLLSPNAVSFTFQWDGRSRPNSECYFTVRAVDRNGRLSAPASAVEASFSQGKRSGSQAVNALVELATPMTNAEASTLPSLKNLRVRVDREGEVLLEWDSIDAEKFAGYVVYRSDYPPAKHSGYFLQLKQTPAVASQMIKAGDMVFVSKKLYASSRSVDLSNSAWGAENEFRKILPSLVRFFPDEDPGKSWELLKHESDTTVSEPGETYLKLKLAAGVKESLSSYTYAGSSQSYYEVLEQKPYRAEVWLRQEGSGSVQFFVSGYYGEGQQKILPVEFSAGPKWQKYVTTFTPAVPYTGNQPGQMGLQFTGPATFYVDNFRIYRADTDYLDFLPEEKQALKSSAMQSLRTHGLIKTGTHTYDLVQLTNPGGVIEGSYLANTLPQILGAFEKVGVDPWLQIECHMTEAEWLGLIEYLAAPFTPGLDTALNKPWAYKRFVQGRQKPWVDSFKKIHFEFGNETWNKLFRPWIFEPMRDASTGRNYSAGEIYGLYQEHVIATMKSSPYWKESGLDSKVRFVLGGHAGNIQYGHDAASASPSSNFLTIGAYIGGWDEAEGPPSLTAKNLFYVLNQINQVGIPTADQLASISNDVASARGRKITIGTYEAGPGYAMNGLNGAKVTVEQSREQELVMKSVAAGTATLDGFLARALRGFYLQNFFTFGTGTRWKSHMPWSEGGKPYPSWELLSLFNNEASGSMLQMETVTVPTIDLNDFGRRKAVRNAPLIAAYATRREDRYSVFVLSRKVPDYPYQGDAGFTPVTLDLPFDRAKSITLFRLVGALESSPPRGDEVRLKRAVITPKIHGNRFVVNAETGADPRGISPGTTLLYVFDGVGKDSSIER